MQTQGQDTSEIDVLISEKNKDLYRRQNEHQQLINKLAEALAGNAETLDLPFNVHTQVGLQFKEGLTREMVLGKINEAINQPLKYNYKKINDRMSVGPTKINEQTGKTEARTLKDFLLAVDENPAHVAYYPDEFKKTKSDGSSAAAVADIKVKSEFSQKHANKKGKPLNTRQSAFAKKIYDDIIVTGPKTGIGVADVAEDDDISFKAVNNAVILWEAVRVIGNVLKDSVLSKEDFGLPMSEQEGIVIKSEKICDGIPFKFTGEFIVTGGQSEFRKDAPKPVSEVNLRYGELLESFAAETTLVAENIGEHIILIPGGFKPPTVGHYKLIQHYERQPDVRKVYVVTGPKPRDGVTLDQSKDIFTIYGGFSKKVEFMASDDPTPMRTCYELMKNDHFISEHTGAIFSLGASDKGNDPKRIRDFAKYFEDRIDSTTAKIAVYSPAEATTVDGEPASASRMRKAFAEEDWDTFKKLLPHPSVYDDVLQVLNKQEDGRIDESFFLTSPLYSLVNEAYSERQRRFMCAVKDKSAAERPKGLSAGEAEEMCTSELSEQQQQQVELDTEQTREISQVVRNLVSKFVELGAAPELKIAAGIESGDINIDDTKKSLVNTIMSYIGSTIDDIMEEQDLSEASVMAAGAVAGYAGPIGTHEDEREKLRNIS